jgi:hypothetical protein
MPEIQPESERQLPLRPPECPTCRKPMQLEDMLPHEKYVNLRHAKFVCECGRRSETLVADL